MESVRYELLTAGAHMKGGVYYEGVHGIWDPFGTLRIGSYKAPFRDSLEIVSCGPTENIPSQYAALTISRHPKVVLKWSRGVPRFYQCASRTIKSEPPVEKSRSFSVYCTSP